MRVLVTGGAGFVGSHIVDRLIERGHDVTVLDNLDTGRLQNVHPAASFVQGDITDPRLPQALAGHSYDAILHQAAQVSVPHSKDDPVFDARVNFVGTARMLDYARRTGVRRFAFASSAAVYGEPGAIPIAEDAPTRPLSPYAMSKLAAEEHLRSHDSSPEVTIIILRYANVYGPRQNMRGEAGVVCAFMHQVLSGQTLTIHGDGLQARDFVYVGDVAEANILALNPSAPAGIYNVGSGTLTSILDLHHLLLGADAPRQHVAARPDDIRQSALDSRAIRGALGWRPEVSLVDGLARTWRHFFRDVKLLPPYSAPSALSCATPVFAFRR